MPKRRMTNPEPIGDTPLAGTPIAGLVDGSRPQYVLTDEVQQWIEADQADDTPEAVRDYVRRLQRKARRDQFLERVPPEFEAAGYEDIEETLPPEGCAAVTGWFTSQKRTLLLVGPTGTGKSHAAYAVLRDAVEHGAWVYGCTVEYLLKTLRPDGPQSPAPRLAEQAEIFLFDDLGVEKSTEWTIAQLSEIVDFRYRERRRQIVTTNLSRAQLETSVGPRVVSRLLASVLTVRFDGADRRTTW